MNLKSLVTYPSELWAEMKKAPSIKRIAESHYTATGIRSVIVDKFDGQHYEVIINPLHKRDEQVT